MERKKLRYHEQTGYLDVNVFIYERFCEDNSISIFYYFRYQKLINLLSLFKKKIQKI